MFRQKSRGYENFQLSEMERKNINKQKEKQEVIVLFFMLGFKFSFKIFSTLVVLTFKKIKTFTSLDIPCYI